MGQRYLRYRSDGYMAIVQKKPQQISIFQLYTIMDSVCVESDVAQLTSRLHHSAIIGAECIVVVAVVIR